MLVVEGEKSADAAEKLFPGYVVTTCMHGAGSVSKADLTPLYGREVFIWPDNDEPGQKYAKDIADRLLAVKGAGKVSIMKILDVSPRVGEGGTLVLQKGFTASPGWDSADAVALGWTAEHIKLLPEDIFEELEPPPTEVFVGKYVVNDQGVHEIRFNDKREPYRVWICSRLDVVARTRNENDQNWGLLLQWKDPDGNVHEWSMPISLLSGSGEQYRQQLLDEGLLIAPGNAGKEALTGYLMAVRSMERALCVDKTGWHGNVFVLPHKTFGQSSERVILQTGESSRTIPFATAGTLEEWNEHVGAKCVGNSRLELSVCVALSGPFLKPMEQENGGLHLRGESSSGKTKALSVAASVWGGKRMVRTWRTTDNAIESLAAEHNECVLILDELGQVDPDKAGDIAYCLGNGQSKARANRFGNARPTMSWSLLFISTGEIPLAEHIAQSGERARAGQEIRLLDIPSDAGRGMGLFENLHGASSARDFADSLQQLGEQYHGTAAEGLLNHLTSDADEVQRAVSVVRGHQLTFVARYVATNASSQVQRAGSRFGLLAGVGEYCSEIGVLPWEVGEATKGVMNCFLAWLETRGGEQSTEEIRALAQVRAFFEKHTAARFTSLDGCSDGINYESTVNRAGYKRYTNEHDRVEYWVLPEVFKQDICAGFDYRFVAKLLRDKGVLVPDGEGKNTTTKRINSLHESIRVFVITAKIFSQG